MANNQEVKLPASEFTEQTVANITEAGTSDFVAGYTLSGGKANRKFSLSNIANYVLNKFKLSLGGSRQTVKSAIDTLNSKTDVGITAAEGVQLSNTSKICVTGTYIFIYVKGKALETKTNAQLCTFGGNKSVYTACTVPIGIGDSEWDISSTGYCFISGKSIVGRVPKDKWFHIFITIPFA